MADERLEDKYLAASGGNVIAKLAELQLLYVLASLLGCKHNKLPHVGIRHICIHA